MNNDDIDEAVQLLLRSASVLCASGGKRDFDWHAASGLGRTMASQIATNNNHRAHSLSDRTRRPWTSDTAMRVRLVAAGMLIDPSLDIVAGDTRDARYQEAFDRWLACGTAALAASPFAIVSRPSPTRTDTGAVDLGAARVEEPPFAWASIDPNGMVVLSHGGDAEACARRRVAYYGPRGALVPLYRKVDTAVARVIAEVKGPAVRGAPTDEEIVAEFDAWRARNEKRWGDGVIVAGAGGCRAIPWEEIDAACGRVRADLAARIAQLERLIREEATDHESEADGDTSSAAAFHRGRAARLRAALSPTTAKEPT